MNIEYAEDSLVRPDCLGPIETDEDEVRLMAYLGAIADGTIWIYTESNRLVEAAQLSLNLIQEKNREIMIARQEQAELDEAIRRRGYDEGYKAGYASGKKAGAARERRKSAEAAPA